MKTEEKKERLPQITIEHERSKYAGKPLNTEKEKAAKKFAPTAMQILKQYGKIK